MTIRPIFAAGALALTVCFASCSSDSSSSTDNNNTPPTPSGIIDMNVSDTSDFITTIDLATNKVSSAINGYAADRTHDGKLIYRDNSGNLVEANPDGSNRRLIVAQNLDLPFEDHHDDYFGNPRGSYDGKYVAYEGIGGNLYVIDRGNGNVVASWEYSGTNPVGYRCPSWTAGGKVVVQGDPTLNPGIYVLDITTKTATQIGVGLTKPLYPNVSQYGQVCFVQNGYIYTMNLDGSSLKQASDSTTTWINTARFPTWSPDAKFIAAYANASTVMMVPTIANATAVDIRTVVTNPNVQFDNSSTHISWR